MKLTDDDLRAMIETLNEGDHDIATRKDVISNIDRDDLRAIVRLVLERAEAAISEGNIGHRPGNDDGDVWDDGFHGGIDYALEKVSAMKPDEPSEGE